MQLKEVISQAEQRLFLEMPLGIYSGIPDWIRPLDKDIQSVFDPAANKSFRHGKAIRWILFDQQGRCIGRIAAFVNKRYRNKGDQGSVGGFGFFECTNDPKAAACLLDAAKSWLQQEGMESMDGPINFGERDKWWGLVTKGFQSPLYCMNYNLPYYQELLEGYGLRAFYHQLCFGMHPHEDLQPKFYERQKALSGDPAYRARYIDTSRLDDFVADFHTVYNKAWAKHAGNKELSLEQCKKLFRSMKPVMDEKIVWFAYYKEEPIAIFINLPDLNQWFRYLNGKFGWFQKLRFLFLKQFVKNTRFVGIVFGVVPEFQGKGVDSFLIAEASAVVKTLPYTEYEMQWIGDFNPRMVAVAESLTPHRSRILTTYRMHFDSSRPFERHPML